MADSEYNVVPEAIDGKKLQKLLGYYPALITELSEAESKGKTPRDQDLLALDNFRYSILHGRVDERFGIPVGGRIHAGKPTQSERSPDRVYGWINLEELKQLMEWKLRRGTNRPTLRQLIASNDDEKVKTTTQAAFAQFGGSNATIGDDIKRKIESLNKLTELKGVGPATATLILSAAFPDDVPFFSDELYAWAVGMKDKDQGFLEELEQGEGKKKWQSKIKLKYKLSEYTEILEAVSSVREKMKAAATDIEKAAFVIMRTKKTSSPSTSIDSKPTSSKVAQTKHESPNISGKKRGRPLPSKKEGDASTMNKRAKTASKPRKRKAG